MHACIPTYIRTYIPHVYIHTYTRTGAYDSLQNSRASRSSLSIDRRDADAIVKRITFNNPILEAFGNAKTLRNDNSSRFGKYLELCFQHDGIRLEGAQIQTYLLEKSRLISQSRGERNFHVFYMFLEALKKDQNTCAELKLRPREEYKYLGGSEGTFEAEGAYEDDLNEAEQWDVVQHALREMGIQEERASIMRVLSFVLLLGNLEFDVKEVGGTPHAKVSDSTRDVLADAAQVILCDEEALEQALVVKKEDKLFGRVPLNAAQAATNRESLAKLLYNELFDWIRECINKELALDGGGDNLSNMRTIGLLDIFGFESFTVFDKKTKIWRTANSLEQLCINFANESLQMLFNRCVCICVCMHVCV
jgi:myosin heavy subunit